jgi:hypothetical protein
MRDESSASDRSPDKKPEKSIESNSIDPVQPHREGKAGRVLKGHTLAGGGAKEIPKLHDPAASKDISDVLKGWDYETGTINVRKVAGRDGQPKLQMRLDLGLIQMELTGRPDGIRPHECDSLLDYFESLLKDHQRRAGSDEGFRISGEQCQALRDEAVQYYHRYLSLFVLGEFLGVVRDTARNLRVLDFCGSYADNDHDRLVLEEFRPYIIMMNARAAAFIQFKEKQYRNALVVINGGLKKIREFFARFGQEDAYANSSEVKVLRKFAKDIRRKLPVDPVRKLQHKLDRAVKAERYEQAAELRDRINEMTARKSIGP